MTALKCFGTCKDVIFTCMIAGVPCVNRAGTTLNFTKSSTPTDYLLNFAANTFADSIVIVFGVTLIDAND